MRVVRFILKRLILAVFTFLVLGLVIFYTASFFDPLSRALLYMSPQVYSHPGWDVYSKLDIIAKKYRLYDPFYIQYWEWLKLALTEGTLGYSGLYSEWVTKVILLRMPATIELVMYSAPLIFLGGLKVGVYSAVRAHGRKRREDPVDFLIRTITVWTYSVPAFFTGIILLSVFFLGLGWVTPGRIGGEANLFINSAAWKSYTHLYTIDALLNGQFWIFIDALKHLALPVATLTISTLPIIVRITRSSMLSELGKPYVIMAEAKGLQKTKVINHARRNAMMSILTISSTIFASMLTGIVVIESTFGLYGIGSLAVEAARGRWAGAGGGDFALLAGLSVFFCLIFVAINMIVDIIYTYKDPRVNL